MEIFDSFVIYPTMILRLNFFILMA